MPRLALSALFIIGVGGVLLLVIPLLGTEIAAFIEKVPEYIGKLQAFANNPGRPWLRKLIGEGLSEAEQSAGQIAALAADWIPTFLRSLWSDSQAVLSILSLMVVTPIVTIYLLIDWKNLIASIDRSIPAAERETYWRSLASSMTRSPVSFAGKGRSASSLPFTMRWRCG